MLLVESVNITGAEECRELGAWRAQGHKSARGSVHSLRRGRKVRPGTPAQRGKGTSSPYSGLAQSAAAIEGLAAGSPGARTRGSAVRRSCSVRATAGMLADEDAPCRQAGAVLARSHTAARRDRKSAPHRRRDTSRRASRVQAPSTCWQETVGLSKRGQRKARRCHAPEFR